MNESDIFRIRHMLEAAKEALYFVSGRKREELDSNRFLMHVLVREIEIIGEAASKVSAETRDLILIDWKAIIGMRNKLIHMYYDIDPDILWHTVKVSIPELIKELEKLKNL